MAIQKIPPEIVTWLVDTMVCLSFVDDKVAPVEVALIERVLKTFDATDERKTQVRRMLDGRAPRPMLVLPPPTMAYDAKLEVFREAVELVFADGVLDKREQDLVMKIANALGLHLSDMQTIWTRGKRHLDR